MNNPIGSTIMRIAILASALAFAFSGHASADVQERYAELQAVPEAINDPDPLMRLALLEAVVAEGDATKVQLALRTAFTVDDPNVRALALRAHLATYKTLIIQAEIPEEAPNTRSMTAFINSLGQTFVVSISGDDITGTEFPINTMNNFTEQRVDRSIGSGNVRGTTITFRGTFWASNVEGRTCSFELHDYDGFLVSGEGNCDDQSGSFRFPVSTRLF